MDVIEFNKYEKVKQESLSRKIEKNRHTENVKQERTQKLRDELSEIDDLLDRRRRRKLGLSY